MWKHLPVSLILALFTQSFAEARILPSFDLEEAQSELSSDFVAGSAIQKGIQQFQVLVFPHRGTYTVPQGRDSKVSAVRITAPAVCKKFSAVMNPSNGEWEKSGNALLEGKDFSLSIATAAAFYFECEAGFKVIRGTGLKSYSYSGNFVSRVKTTSLQIINIISPEEYLKGVVPAEVVPTWPLEVLRTQAVAARTYAWWSVTQSRANNSLKPFDMDDTVQYQAYVGTGTETTGSNQAIADTQNQVIRYQGKIIKAYFSADSGGYTEAALNPFNENLPYCQSKPELYPAEAIATDWTMNLSLSSVAQKLSAKSLIPSGVVIVNIEVKAQNLNESGRANVVSIYSSTGKVYSVTGAKFRLALGLKSTLFQHSIVKTKNSTGQFISSITFQGKGHGHGVGMSQRGTLAYVQTLGWSYEQILKHYYSDVTISE